MAETTNLVLAIFSAILVWTCSVIGGMVWLNAKFRGVEKTIYREADKLRREYEGRLYGHNTRIQRLEIKAFGFSGGNGGMSNVDEGQSFP